MLNSHDLRSILCAFCLLWTRPWTVDPSGSMSTHQVVNRRTLTRSAVKKFSTSAAYGCLSCLVWILVALAVQPPRSCKSLPAVACCSKIPRQVRTYLFRIPNGPFTGHRCFLEMGTYVQKKPGLS